MFRHLSTTFSKSFSTKSFPFKLGKVNHIAIAVPNVEEAGKLYSNILLADNVSEIKEVKSQKVKVLFVDLGNTKIELLEPTSKDSPISKFLQKNKYGGMHHICIEVKNLDEMINHIKKEHSKDLRLLGNEPVIGAHGKRIIFLHPVDCNGTLIELEEE